MALFQPQDVRLLRDMPGAKRSKRRRAGSIVQLQSIPRNDGSEQQMLGFLDERGNGTVLAYDPIEGFDYEK